MCIAEMNSKAASYRLSILRQRLLAKQANKDKAEKIHLLNRYADMQSLSLPGFKVEEFDLDLAARAQATLARCESINRKRDTLREESFCLLCDALVAIGRHHGRDMAADHKGTVRQRFRRHWVAANKYRRLALDGRCLNGLLFDREGPMFKAFVHAAGFRKIADFEQALRQ